MAPLHTGSYAAAMTVHQLPFGVLLRRWRERRRMTQADLALTAKSSTRHLSCLETGRSQPSREMIARLAEYLGIPLRDQNALLLAAGFAPAFKERSLAELEAAKAAVDSVLQAHKPYPAFAVDRRWNVVLSNSALPQLYEGCSADLMRPPVNAVRLILHPAGMGPRIVNFAAWRAHTLSVLRQQIETRAASRHSGAACGSGGLSSSGQYRNVRQISRIRLSDKTSRLHP